MALTTQFVPNVTPANEGAPSWALASADGAVTPGAGVVLITKAGVCAITLAVPSTALNGAELTFIATTANAHTITTPADGVNNDDNTLTFGGALGDSVVLRAYGGKWWVVSAVNVTASTV